ncbi:MAG: amino acid carrier protein [Oscillibacter sp.]|nr:amino acid carrier protein [Oscillibacter sp.]
MIIYKAISAFADWAWGTPMLIWLVGGGIVLTIAVGGIQFRRLGYVLKHTIGENFRKKGENGKISGYQAVISALSATLGTGNIVGVGAAIALGGPGAVFWMWVVGCVAMGIKYCEALASVKFREPNVEAGGYKAGPSMYLRKGAHSKFLAGAYGIFATWGLLMSGPEHTSAIVDVVQQATDIPRIPIMIVCVVIVAVVMLGGLKRFVQVSEVIVPVMAILYCGVGLIILVMNITAIPGVFVEIFRCAFTGQAAVGGFAGATFAQALRWGTSRGMYSSDAGNGLQSIMHGQAEVEHPVQQAMWGVFEVFVDTIVVCTFTALVILCTGVWETGNQGSSLALNAFTQSCGVFGTAVECIALFFFSITSAIAMAAFLERHANMLFGKKVTVVLQVLYLIMMVVGGYSGFDAVLPFTDMASAMMIFINITGLIIMIKVLRNETKDYFENFIRRDSECKN